jgi:CHASE1-domain containing sensor protein
MGPIKMYKFSRPLTMSLVVLCAGLLLSVVADNYQSQQEQAEAKVHFAMLAQRAGDQLQRRFVLYQYGLRGARGAIIGAGKDQIHVINSVITPNPEI